MLPGGVGTLDELFDAWTSGYLCMHDKPVVVLASIPAAIDQAADIVGISVLSGAHIVLSEQLLAAMDAAGSRVPVVVGGTVPEGDAQLLRAMGIADVLPVGTPLDEVVSRIVRIASEPAALR